MVLNRTSISAAVLLIFYTIGILGISSDYQTLFLSLTPYNLLLTLAIIAFNHQDWNAAKWLFPVTLGAGLLVEIIGVNTGFPFGEYAYGWVLGPTIFDTPYMIGVNWLILIYATNAIAQKWSALHSILRASIAAFLMVLLDILIEPVAVALDFWSWTETEIPFSNYAAWFAISLLLSILWQQHRNSLNFPIGLMVFTVQVCFFFLLNLI